MTALTDDTLPVTPRTIRDEMILFVVMAAALAIVPFTGLYPFFVMQALCFAFAGLRVQPADRLWRAAVVRPCDVPGQRRLFHRACAEGVGGYARAWHRYRHPRGRRHLQSSPASSQSAARAIYFAMITLALSQLLYFIYLQTPFTHGEDGIQASRRDTCSGSSISPSRRRCIT